ncbi:MAG: hypothetical protein PVJ21_15660, partial [Anaerolineales bacterium]
MVYRVDFAQRSSIQYSHNGLLRPHMIINYIDESSEKSRSLTTNNRSETLSWVQPTADGVPGRSKKRILGYLRP